MSPAVKYIADNMGLAMQWVTFSVTHDIFESLLIFAENQRVGQGFSSDCRSYFSLLVHSAPQNSLVPRETPITQEMDARIKTVLFTSKIFMPMEVAGVMAHPYCKSSHNIVCSFQILVPFLTWCSRVRFYTSVPIASLINYLTVLYHSPPWRL